VPVENSKKHHVDPARGMHAIDQVVGARGARQRELRAGRSVLQPGQESGIVRDHQCLRSHAAAPLGARFIG
jgi:hypothetical protein